MKLHLAMHCETMKHFESKNKFLGKVCLHHVVQGPAEIPDDWRHSRWWNRWHGEFVLERSSSETQSISVAMERWSVEHQVFAVEMIFKNNDSVIVTQMIFRRHFNIHRNACP
jgi:hypothetical protein